MAGTKEIRTDRLLLRRHVLEDAATLHENFGRDEAMYEYSGWNPYATPEAAERTVRSFIDSYPDPHFYGWAIESEGRLIGTIGAYDYDAEKNTIELGMSIEKPSWGKGFATEALTAVLSFLSNDEKIATMTGWCAADNVGSQRAMEKSGMVKVDVEERSLEIGRNTFDKFLYEYRATE